jgi:DNA-binding transcriptional LysR family regulator
MVMDHIKSGELKVLLGEWAYEGDWIYMVHPRRYFSPRFRVFSDFIRGLLPATPRWEQGAAIAAK